MSPISHNISAGAAYGDYNIEVGLEVGEDGSGSYSGKSYMLFDAEDLITLQDKELEEEMKNAYMLVLS